MKFEVYSSYDQEWSDIINQFPSQNTDIYFLREWYQTWLSYEDSEAFCIHCEIDGFRFLYPFLKRKISKYSLSKKYFDIQSAYGYGGIISSLEIVPSDIQSKLNSLIDDYLHDSSVIAEFIRVHPLLDSVLRTSEYSVVRKNVFVITSESYRIPHKQARQNISRAKSANLEVQIDASFRHLDEFIRLYRLTAGRLNMSGYYWFNEDYFNRVVEMMRGMSTLIHISYQGQIIASGLLLFYNGKASLHLAASDDAYFNFRPNDFLYYATIEYCKEANINILNLGGGLSSNQDDSLFKFKTKYGSFSKDVIVGKNIINREIYKMISQEWSSIYPELVEKYRNYLLCYRMEE